MDELAPLGLAAAARRLGMSPFELVRTAVASGNLPPGTLRFEETWLAKVAAQRSGAGAKKSSKARADKGP